MANSAQGSGERPFITYQDYLRSTSTIQRIDPRITYLEYLRPTSIQKHTEPMSHTSSASIYSRNTTTKHTEGSTDGSTTSEMHRNTATTSTAGSTGHMGSCSDTKAKIKELEKSLSNLVGLHKLKSQIMRWAKGILLDERRRALGIRVATNKCAHMAFRGNPGTGKTTVARMLGKLLHAVRIISKDIVIEVQRTDLVGEYVGQTGMKTRRKIEEANGGILFVDEAYRLVPYEGKKSNDYGMEALEEIMTAMDNGKVLVIFAGYHEPMKGLLSSNQGLARRVTKLFDFDDYTPTELAEIMHIKMKKQSEDDILFGFKLHSLCTLKAIAELIKKGTSKEKRQEMNGGLVDVLLANARENLDQRLDCDCKNAESLITITMEDLREGLRLFLS